MKAIPLILFYSLFILFTHFCSMGQRYYPPQSAEIDSFGVMKNREGQVFVIISTDSIIKDTNGEIIAFINRNGKLVSKEGIVLGATSINGDFYNIQNQVEYTVLPYKNGLIYNVYDNTGYQVLSVPAYYKTQAGSLAFVHKSMLSNNKNMLSNR